MKQRVEGLKSVHVYLSRYSPRALGPIDEASLRAAPHAIQPMVHTHPENGRKALY